MKLIFCCKDRVVHTIVSLCARYTKKLLYYIRLPRLKYYQRVKMKYIRIGTDDDGELFVLGCYAGYNGKGISAITICEASYCDNYGTGLIWLFETVRETSIVHSFASVVIDKQNDE